MTYTSNVLNTAKSSIQELIDLGKEQDYIQEFIDIDLVSHIRKDFSAGVIIDALIIDKMTLENLGMETTYQDFEDIQDVVTVSINAALHQIYENMTTTNESNSVSESIENTIASVISG